MATLGVLTVEVKARCWFEVVSYVCGICDFWQKSRTKRLPGDLSRNPLVTLCVSDRSRCGAARILRSLAQPIRHLAWTEILLWDLLQRSSAENLFRQFVEMAFHRDLAQQLLQRTCQGDLAHDLPQRSSQRELVESDLVSFFHVPCNTVWGVLPRSFFSYVWTEPLDVTVRPTETKAMPFRSVATSPDSARLSGTQVDPGTKNVQQQMV